jgi:RimJ/RimL family protein N-acetyltransferase
MDDYQIRPIKLDDAGEILKWRNQQINVLRQSKKMTPQSQHSYFENVIKPQLQEPEPTQILFGFEHRGILIGYGGLVHISWTDLRAEMSFLLSKERSDKAHYSKDMSAFLYLIIQVAQTQLEFHRLYTETYSFRLEHIDILELNGFIREGTLRDHVYHEGLFGDAVIHGLILSNGSQT